MFGLVLGAAVLPQGCSGLNWTAAADLGEHSARATASGYAQTAEVMATSTAELRGVGTGGEIGDGGTRTPRLGFSNWGKWG